MPEEYVTVQEVRAWVCAKLRNRPDMGLRKAILDGVLDPPNPFEPTAKRAPQRWFVLACILAGMAAACFLYYDVLRR